MNEELGLGHRRSPVEDLAAVEVAVRPRDAEDDFISRSKIEEVPVQVVNHHRIDVEVILVELRADPHVVNRANQIGSDTFVMDSFWSPTLHHGKVAVSVTGLSGSSSLAVVTNFNGPLQSIGVTGQTAPSGAPFHFSSFGSSPDMNGSGIVFHGASVSSNGDPYRIGVYRWDGNRLTTVADTTTLLPDSNEPIHEFGTLAIQGNRAVFMAEFLSGDSTKGIFRETASGLRTLLSPNTILPGESDELIPSGTLVASGDEVAFFPTIRSGARRIFSVDQQRMLTLLADIDDRIPGPNFLGYDYHDNTVLFQKGRPAVSELGRVGFRQNDPTIPLERLHRRVREVGHVVGENGRTVGRSNTRDFVQILDRDRQSAQPPRSVPGTLAIGHDPLRVRACPFNTKCRQRVELRVGGFDACHRRIDQLEWRHLTEAQHRHGGTRGLFGQVGHDGDNRLNPQQHVASPAAAVACVATGAAAASGHDRIGHGVHDRSRSTRRAGRGTMPRLLVD